MDGLVIKLCPTLKTPWTIACQAPLSMGFSRQEYWSGLPFLTPGVLPNPETEHCLLHCRKILYHLSYQESPQCPSCNLNHLTGKKKRKKQTNHFIENDHQIEKAPPTKASSIVQKRKWFPVFLVRETKGQSNSKSAPTKEIKWKHPNSFQVKPPVHCHYLHGCSGSVSGKS